MLDSGLSLSQVNAELARRLGIAVQMTPVSDQSVRTMVDTDEGLLTFQHYFVRHRCEPTIRSICYVGASGATLAPTVRETLYGPRLAGVIVCPSNPYLSIAPMLAIPELRQRLRDLQVPVVAVSPIVAGAAVNGPTTKIMHELGIAPAADIIATLYEDFVDTVVLDEADAVLAKSGDRFAVLPTIMRTREQRAALARACINLIKSR